jgi:divalent metal cation (Fe/Co/Zn/Cd) transporter
MVANTRPTLVSLFGTCKLGDLAGFTSAIVLAMIALLIGYEAVSRFLAPVPGRIILCGIEVLSMMAKAQMRASTGTACSIFQPALRFKYKQSY